LDQLQATGLAGSCQVIAVNDGSSDATEELLAAFPWVEALHLPVRSGYGAALKAGFRRAKGEWIVFLDMDGTYDPADLENLFRSAQSSGCDLVFGDRLSGGEGMPALRRWGNYFFTWLVRSLHRQPLKDACTGYRLFHRKWLQEIQSLPHSGLDYSLGLTLWAIRQGVAFHEVPVHYHPRQGKSKLNVMGDGMRFFRLILSGPSREPNS
jgi:glycosyltransferase involved in cell wall biosynthesis